MSNLLLDINLYVIIIIIMLHYAVKNVWPAALFGKFFQGPTMHQLPSRKSNTCVWMQNYLLLMSMSFLGLTPILCGSEFDLPVSTSIVKRLPDRLLVQHNILEDAGFTWDSTEESPPRQPQTIHVSLVSHQLGLHRRTSPGIPSRMLADIWA